MFASGHHPLVARRRTSISFNNHKNQQKRENVTGGNDFTTNGGNKTATEVE